MSTMNLMEKVAEVAPDIYGFIIKTAGEVKASPFRDEILTELATISKTAEMGMWGKAGLGLATTVGAGIAMNLAGDMYDSLRRGITKGRDYKSMMRENPDLGEHDAKQVQKIFSTMHRFNPEFASDPTVAGSFVRNRVQMGLQGVDMKEVAELVGARKDMKDLKQLPSHDMKLDFPESPEATSEFDQMRMGAFPQEQSRQSQKHKMDMALGAQKLQEGRRQAKGGMTRRRP